MLALSRIGFLSFLVPLALIACGGRSGPSATQPPPPSPPAVISSEPAASAVPAAAPREQADGQRILARDRHLADDIGLRDAGSSREQEAIDYAAGELRSYGYDVSIQSFSISTEASREAALAVQSPAARKIDAIPLGQSASGEVRGQVAFGGLGSPGELAGVAGKIALIERGDLTFQQKVLNAQEAGAKAAIIFNNAPGNFLGSLSARVAIPVVAVSQESGRSLSADLKAGPEELALNVAAPGTATSHNVIAKPPGHDCETVSGGHIDSIVGPGANDNASGASTVLEIASVIASNGEMAANCFVLFGAEEPGLLGSKAFVQSLDGVGRARLRAMVNYDMVGVGGDGWLLIGNSELQQRGVSLAGSLGIENVKPGSLPSNTGSDHATFIAAGIPALMVYRTTDNLLHTPQDLTARVRPELLEQAGRFGVALLESLNAGG